MFLVGCAGGGIVTPAGDEAAIKSVVNEYFLAINDQNWSKAKIIVFTDRTDIMQPVGSKMSLTPYINMLLRLL